MKGSCVVGVEQPVRTLTGLTTPVGKRGDRAAPTSALTQQKCWMGHQAALPITLFGDRMSNTSCCDLIDLESSVYTVSSPCHAIMVSWSMRSWESEPRPALSGGRADSQDRMDRQEGWQSEFNAKLRRRHLPAAMMRRQTGHSPGGSVLDQSHDVLIDGTPSRWCPTAFLLNVRFLLTRPWHDVAWSMRPWESARPEVVGRGSDFQDRMDRRDMQILAMAG